MAILTQPADNSELPVIIPRLGGLTKLDAWLTLAAAGLYTVPVHPTRAGGKSPGSYVGEGWQYQSSIDPDQIARWDGLYPRAAIGIHTGRSGLVIAPDLDVDELPAELDWCRRGRFQTGRAGLLDWDVPTDHGHYVFASTTVFVSGPLKCKDGTKVGEVRSGNTIILTQPSAHHKEPGGGYRWETTGVVPPLPSEAIEGGYLRVHPHPPGWDCHGNPLNARRNGGNGRSGDGDGAGLGLGTDYPSDDDSTDEQIEAWARVAFNSGGAGAMCAATAAVMSKWIMAVELDDASYPNLSAGHWQLLNLAAEAGHTGWDAACTELDTAYLAEVVQERGKRPDAVARAEIRRSRRDALRKIKALVERAAAVGVRYTPAHCDCPRRRGPSGGPAGLPARISPGVPTEVETLMGLYDYIPEPGGEEFKEAVQRGAWAKLLDAEIKAEEARLLHGEAASSWERIDLHDVIYGELAELVPAVLARADGECLGYPGCTHSVHGPTGSGKTWLALLGVAQCLKQGLHALYLDYESFPVQIVKRLLALGVSQEAIDERLHYYRPEAAPDVLDADRNAFSHLLSREYAVAVIDGANISLALCGLNPDSATDVACWHRKIMFPIAEKTGAAVFANDHVPKNNSSYSGFAIGSQHKVAGLTGAAFVMEKMVTFGRGRHGVATVRVGDKDREGYVHAIGVDDGQPDGMLVGELHVDAERQDTTTVELRTPSKEIAAAVADKRSKRAAGGGAVRDVAYEMEIVSDYWRVSTDPRLRTQNKTIEALLARQGAGWAYERTLTNRALRLAVKALADPEAIGGPYAVEDTAVSVRGGSHPYTSVTPYTRLAVAAFPLSSKHKKGGADDGGDD